MGRHSPVLTQGIESIDQIASLCQSDLEAVRAAAREATLSFGKVASEGKCGMVGFPKLLVKSCEGASPSSQSRQHSTWASEHVTDGPVTGRSRTHLLLTGVLLVVEVERSVLFSSGTCV